MGGYACPRDFSLRGHLRGEGAPVTAPAKRRLWISVVSAATATAVVVAFLIFTSGPATAKEFATLHLLEGAVEVKLAGEGTFASGNEGQTLKTGDVVRTGPDGRAEIEYFDGSLTRLDVGTTFELTELASVTDLSGSKIIEGSQEGGRTLSRVAALTDSESRVEVETPNAIASVRGTEFVTIVNLDGSSEYWLLDGMLLVKGDEGGATILESGEGVSVGNDGIVGEPFFLSDAQLGLLCGFVDAGQRCEVTEVDPKTEQRRPERDVEPPEDILPLGPETTETTTLGPEDPDIAEDRDPPATTITSGPDGRTRSRTATFGFVSSEPASTFRCSLDLGPFTSCSTGKSYAGLGDGPHSFAVVARDAAGNVDPTPSFWAWRVDATGPDTTITSGPAGNTTSREATFGYTSSESPSTFTCRLDGGAAGACGSGLSGVKSYEGLPLGDHTFEVWATDDLGNVDASPARFTWTILGEGVDPKNHKPEASRPDNVFTREGQPVSFTLVATDPDQNDPLTFHIVAAPDHGTLSGDAPGLTYTPDPGFAGVDAFRWMVNDGQLDSNIATTTIHVRPASTGGGAQGFPEEDASRTLVLGDNTDGYQRGDDGQDGSTGGDGGSSGGGGTDPVDGSDGGDGGGVSGGSPGGGEARGGTGGDVGGGTQPAPEPSPTPTPTPEPPPADGPTGPGNGNGKANGLDNGKGTGKP
jgi:hypothetical protein